jgi:ascorbate-specific PTS system EIIC-type component UlaA
MFNNVLPAILTTTMLYMATLCIWLVCGCIGREQFLQWLPHVIGAGISLGAFWGLSEGNVSDYPTSVD